MIPLPSPLRNRYVLMRHGHSLANERGIILSDPLWGTIGWGLSTKGKAQIEMLLESIDSPWSPLIISSDFTRARESAQLVALNLKLPEPLLDIRLRERFFGDLEGQEDSLYGKVWTRDRENSGNNWMAVESPVSVQSRTASLIVELEGKYDNREILLVSHGDSLQILQTWFQQIDPGQHREVDHLNTGVIRPLSLLDQ